MYNNNEYGFLDDLDLESIFVDSAREAMKSLDPVVALLAKYDLIDGLPKDQILDRCDKDSFDNVCSYSYWLSINYDDFVDDLDDDFDDGFDDDFDGESDGYSDPLDDNSFDAFCDNVVDEAVRGKAVYAIESVFLDKLFGIWSDAYEKQNGHPHPFCDALRNFDSLSESGWFDDISDSDSDLDPDVAMCLREAFDDCVEKARGMYDTSLPADYAFIKSIRNRCTDSNFSMTDHERESCTNFLNWCKDDLHDYLRSRLKSRAMTEMAVSLYEHDSGDNIIYRAFFGNDLSAYYSSDPEYHEPPKPTVQQLVTDFRDRISADGIFDDIEKRTGGVVRFEKRSRNERDCAADIVGFTRDVAASFSGGKPHWSSRMDFVVDCLQKYVTDEYAAAIRDGSYKNAASFDVYSGHVLNIPPRDMPHLVDEHRGHLGTAAYCAVSKAFDVMERDFVAELRAMMAPGGDFDSDKFMREAFASNFETGGHDAAFDLFVSLCRSGFGYENGIDFDPSSINKELVAVYGHDIDFDALDRVSGCTRRGCFGTSRAIKCDIDSTFERIESDMALRVAGAAACMCVGLDADKALFPESQLSDCFAREDEIAARAKNLLPEKSPLPPALQTAFDNLDNCGDESDKDDLDVNDRDMDD